MRHHQDTVYSGWCVEIKKMRWWWYWWHKPLSCQWGSRSQAFGIPSPDSNVFVLHFSSSCFWVSLIESSSIISISWGSVYYPRNTFSDVCPLWLNDTNRGDKVLYVMLYGFLFHFLKNFCVLDKIDSDLYDSCFTYAGALL